MKTAYTYVVLRYVHDEAAAEFLNVGVVLVAPATRYLAARIQTNYGRLRKTFPSLDGDAHRNRMRSLQRAFDGLQSRFGDELPFDPMPADAAIAAAQVLPHDERPLQWSPLGSGLTGEPSAELERLYSRLVSANDSPRANGGRSDEVIWSVYRAALARHKVLHLLQPHRVVAENDEVEFEHAWHNNLWHCLQPLSLDYIDAASIKSKAHGLLGQMFGIRSAVTDHCLYLLVGEPQLERCKAPAQRYLNLLHKELPLRTEIIREADADAFSINVARSVRMTE